jgi:putative Holliday junction resolvase
MRILALDHGTVRVGVAVSDDMKVLALPLEFIPAEPLAGCIAKIQQLIVEKEVELVVVGMPRNMDGTYGPAAEKVRAFVAALTPQITAPIRLLDERLSSVQAHRMLHQAGLKAKQHKGKVDQTAAAILLQSYLDNLT